MQVIKVSRDFELKDALIHGGSRPQTIPVRKGTTGILEEENGRVTFQSGTKGSYTGYPSAEHYTIVP